VRTIIDKEINESRINDEELPQVQFNSPDQGVNFKEPVEVLDQDDQIDFEF
jgi:hypothetical protein